MDIVRFRDRIGETTVSTKCAICQTVSCFSCDHSYCTAFEKISTGGCAFYKDADKNRREIRKCFYQLIYHERFDLLRKYVNIIAALGLMEKELKSAAQQHTILEQLRSDHLKSLYSSHWKASLVEVAIVENEDIDESEYTDAQSESWGMDSEDEVDNDLDTAIFPKNAMTVSLDSETIEDINVQYDAFLTEETQYTVEDIINVISETDDGLNTYILSPDEAEDFSDENTLNLEESIERIETATLAKEVEQEKIDANTEAEKARISDGNETYISMPVNYFFRKIGFPLRQPKEPDPVDLAYQNLGAGMIYAATEDYITVLRMLWSNNYSEKVQYQLIVTKWELETMIGSKWYWQFTNINPNRIIDQCWSTAEKQAMEKIKRLNRRIAAGIEYGEKT